MSSRVLYLFSTMLVFLNACNKEEPVASAIVSSEEIRFDSPAIALNVSHFTRASGPVDIFPSGGSFGVLGYCLANYDGSNVLNPATGATPWESKAVLSSPHLFYKTEVKYNGAVCYYTGEQKRWYEQSDYLYTFLAYYPYGDMYYTVEPATQTGIGFPSLTFTMPFSGGDISTLRTMDDIPDAMVAAAIDVARKDGPVKLLFNHLFTGINFTINNYNETNDLTIHGLRVSGNFYRSIQIHMNEGLEYTPDTYAGTFTFLDGNDDSDDIMVEHDKSSQKVGNKTLMLISNLSAAPNYLGNDVYIHLDYSFMGKRVTDKTIALPFGYLPQGGTIYTLEMNFIGDALVLNFVVDNNQVWEDGGDSGIKFE